MMMDRHTIKHEVVIWNSFLSELNVVNLKP